MKTELKSDWVTCPSSKSPEMPELGFQPKSLPSCSFFSTRIPLPSFPGTFWTHVVPKTLLPSGYTGLVTVALQHMPTIILYPPMYEVLVVGDLFSHKGAFSWMPSNTPHELNKRLPLGCDLRAIRKPLQANWSLVTKIILFYQSAKFFHQLKWKLPQQKSTLSWRQPITS